MTRRQQKGRYDTRRRGPGRRWASLLTAAVLALGGAVGVATGADGKGGSDGTSRPVGTTSQLRAVGAARTAVTWHPGRNPLPAPVMTPRIIGITIDNVDQVAVMVERLRALRQRPMVRIVFDVPEPPSSYAHAVRAIAPHADILGQIADSSELARISKDALVTRTRAYLAAFGSQVDLWEIGNEVNGEWTGTPRDVVAKVTATYDVVHAAGKPTAVTLYYNPNCWEKADHEMFRWTSAHLPQRLRTGVDYAFISYFEQDCNNLRPTNWTSVFRQLRDLFPTARLGFGEVGLTEAATPATLRRASDVMRHYYAISVPIRGYVGGYFWWYGAQDILGRDAALWSQFSALNANY